MLGAGGRIRTPDLLITNQLLYQLSYTSPFAPNPLFGKPPKWQSAQAEKETGDPEGARTLDL